MTDEPVDLERVRAIKRFRAMSEDERAAWFAAEDAMYGDPVFLKALSVVERALDDLESQEQSDDRP